MHRANKITTLAATLSLLTTPALADGIVAKIVNSPLNSAGLGKDGYTALNDYLQKPGAEGIEFYNPEIPGFGIPAALARFDSGLIVRDTDGNGKLDPSADRIIGGVTTDAPDGDRTFDVRSLAEGNAPLLSQPTGFYSERSGERIGGAIMQVQFNTGAAKGKYRPTFALLNDPDDPTSGDGTSYTYTVIAQ